MNHVMLARHRKTHWASALGLAILFVSGSAHAAAELPELTLQPSLLADAPPDAPATGAYMQSSDQWKFKLGVPVWIPSLNGDVSVRERTLTVDQDTEDVVDLLDGGLNFAIAAHLEVEKGRFGLIADILYLSVEGDSEERNGGSIDASGDAWIGELDFFYTLVPAKAGEKFPFRLDLLGGVRVQGLGIEVDTDNLGSADRSRTWVDPIVGARAELGLLKWLSLKARGDIGGFGISEGNTSDLVWNVDAAASFHLCKWFHIDLGYRWLDYDYQDGSGDDLFKFDAMLHGPYVNFEFRF